jgi:hypothetical protein
MGTTSNYSWPYPAATDPVADGAQNIEDLATDADTTVRSVELATVMRFADAAARTTALSGIEVEGMVTFTQDDDVLAYWDGSAWQPVGGATMIKKVAAFTASGSWTVPAGVTYAIAHMLGGGGGGAGQSTTGGAGGTSSVAFSGGTVSAIGGRGGAITAIATNRVPGAEAANSGRGGAPNSDTPGSYNHQGSDAQWVVAGDTVTPAASITVTVGAGGTAGTGATAGGSGYVWIEYLEEA